MTDTSPRRPGGRRGLRVVVVDDHELVRRGLREVLTEFGDIEVVGEAGTAPEAVRRIRALRPDVALLDVRLPGGGGIEVCRQVRAADPGIRVLMITSYDDPEAVYAAILAGASGYVLKEIHGTTLIDAVRRVASGQSLLDPAVTGQVLERLRHPAAVDPQLGALTAQERRILDLIVDGMTNREIGAALHVSEQTVKNHVTSLLAKLNVSRRTQAAVFGARVRVRQGGRPAPPESG
jgi:two-component system, NarL family, response regulator DevR